MKVIRDYIDGDLEIFEDTEIAGEVVGDVTVEEATLVVSGSVKGKIIANEGSTVDLLGDCEELRADAADLSISGIIFGDLIYRDTYVEIDENATIHGDVIDENEDGRITRYGDYDDELNEDDNEKDEDDDDNDYYGVDDDDYGDDDYNDDDFDY